MTTIKTYTAIPKGYDGQLITVEADMRKGLPVFNIVGMASRSISESRERIRSAITNSGFDFPKQKLVINLAPADLEKSGTSLDLAISIAILAISKQILPQNIQSSMFIGELALDGKIRPTGGIIHAIECAKKQNFQHIFIPLENAAQAAILAKEIEIIPVKNLRELWLYLKNLCKIDTLKSVVKNTTTDKNQPIFDQISGQGVAKRALTIALAGHHNVLMTGPPGSGKTSLAKACAALQPAPSATERLEILKIANVVKNTETDANRPFRSPQHSSSATAILGGGKHGAPGEISLAHNGILFLDEFSEFAQPVIDALREPLESHQINLARADYCISYPADFILIATTNPCPCGNFGSRKNRCKCPMSAIERYRNKLSRPVLDRIDIKIQVESPPSSVLFKNTTISTREYDTAKTQILRAIERQHARYANQNTQFNGRLNSYQTSSLLQLDPAAERTLNSEANRLNLTARSYFKAIRLAQTICDIDNLDHIAPPQIEEALTYVSQKASDY